MKIKVKIFRNLHNPFQLTLRFWNLILIATGVICFFQTTVFALPSNVSVQGNQLMVSKRNADNTLGPSIPYTIHGVTWAPATRAPQNGPNPIGTGTVPYGFFFNWEGRVPQGHEVFQYWSKSEFKRYYLQDLALMKQMNVNTVRVYDDISTNSIDGLKILDECYRQGIMVIMTVAAAKSHIDSGEYLKIVDKYKNHPAILMWEIGNEWNFNNFYGYQNTDASISAINTVVQQIKLRDTNHPVSSTLGDLFVSSPVVCTPGDSCCTPSDGKNNISYIVPRLLSIDTWGLNVYRQGSSINQIFNQWKQVSSKPFYISEFGLDSYQTTNYTFVDCNKAAHIIGTDDQSTQTQMLSATWQNIIPHLSKNKLAEQSLGGLVHSFNDHLWKVGSFNAGLGNLVNYNGPDGIANTADDDSSYDQYNKEGFLLDLPDKVANEEYFGVVDADRVPKAAFTVLKNIYAQLKQNAPQYSLSVSKSGTGSGTVTSVPAGIDCGIICNLNFNSDLNVNLSASAASGSIFKGWSGACSGTGSCVVLMTAAQSVTASFELVPTISTASNAISAGSALSVTWAGITSPSITDWIGLYLAGGTSNTPIAWIYTSSCAKSAGSAAKASGTCYLPTSASLATGNYEIRLYAKNGYTQLAKSGSFSITGAPAAAITAPTTATVGSSITVDWNSVISPSTTDWVGLYLVGGTSNATIAWIYTSSCAKSAGSTPKTSGTCGFSLPAHLATGNYEVRLFGKNSYSQLAKSSLIAIAGAPGILISAPSSAIAGSSITVSWSSMISPSTTDWVGLYLVGGTSNSPITWIYTSSCTKSAGNVLKASGTCGFSLPSNLAAGNYEVRLFEKNSYTQLAKSGLIKI